MGFNGPRAQYNIHREIPPASSDLLQIFPLPTRRRRRDEDGDEREGGGRRAQRRVPLPGGAVARGGAGERGRVDLQLLRLLHAWEHPLRRPGGQVHTRCRRRRVPHHLHLRHPHGQAHLLQGLRHHLLLHPAVQPRRHRRHRRLRRPGHPGARRVQARRREELGQVVRGERHLRLLQAQGGGGAAAGRVRPSWSGGDGRWMRHMQAIFFFRCLKWPGTWNEQFLWEQGRIIKVPGF